MNDFDSIIGEAVGHRADNAPLDRPDFGDVLGARQQRLRRRSVIGAFGVLAIGATGMAAFAVGGPADSTADGPDTPIGSDGPFASTIPGATLDAPETIWYCEGAVDQNIADIDHSAIYATTTTIAPPTTVAAAVLDSYPAPDVTYVPPSEDFGFFRNCVLIESGAVAPADGDVAITTYTEQFPIATTTTSIVQVPSTDSGDPDGAYVPRGGTYVVQSGDSPVSVAENFEVSLVDLLNFNGWVTPSEFPFPGEEIQIPPLAHPSCTVPGCDTAAIHTVQSGDYLIKIADDYCVSAEAILALNGWDSGQDLPFPGERVLVPAGPTDGTCPDNGGD